MRRDSLFTRSRRAFLKFLAQSPAFALLGQSTYKFAGKGDGPVGSPEEAINVFDFEIVAQKSLDPAHWGYLSTGTDDDGTIRANRDGFSRFQLRPRRLVDVRRIDTETEILGARWSTPIVLAPTGRQRAFHPDGEIAVARGARAGNHLQILSTVTSTGVEDVIQARGAPIWYQLYAEYDWATTRALVRRAEEAGCTAVVLTVDLQGGSNRETVKRFARLDERDCSACHPGAFADYIRTKPMYDGLDVEGDSNYEESLNWDFVKKLQDTTTMKVLVKGIVTGEDTLLAVENGLDGVIVSNHGGRAENSTRGTIECLPEVVEAASGRLAVLVDGGFRRGTDIFKALALGADAVCIGRPYLWGLASFGQPGVEAVLDLLRKELVMVMKQMGTTTIAAIEKSSVVARPS
ncbi:MAG TPA: alpha-hydroxy acid oxidase [Vicinamibacteria bacterium]|nr:alpha-hydroxy acid oxidase [Vicinamibacteria bacterium]